MFGLPTYQKEAKRMIRYKDTHTFLFLSRSIPKYQLHNHPNILSIKKQTISSMQVSCQLFFVATETRKLSFIPCIRG